MPNDKKEPGPTAERVAANVRILRQERGLGLAQLSELMSEAGQGVSLGALSKLENGDRRVDVDDLMALAVALDVSPARLLLPATANPDEEIGLTPETTVSEREAWQWSAGNEPLPDGRTVLDLGRVARFEVENRPHDPPDETSLAQMRDWGRDGTLSGLRDGYRAALSSGVSHGAARVYLDMIDNMAGIREIAEERANGERR